MGLKQVKDNHRIIFLRMFIEELLYNSLEERRLKLSIEAEKIKQKYLEPNKEHVDVFKSLIRGLPLEKKEEPSVEKKEIMPVEKAKENIVRPMQTQKYMIKFKPNSVFVKGNLMTDEKKLIKENPSAENNNAPKSVAPRRNIIQPRPVGQQVQKQVASPVTIIKNRPIQANNNLQPSLSSTRDSEFDSLPLKPVPRPYISQEKKESVSRIKELMVKPRDIPVAQSGDFGYKKVENLLRDTSIQSIECQGPGKDLVVRRQNKMQRTKITLNQPEIIDVIGYYSREARIPLVGGILKAAVSNSIISAVNSEFVGARFIINKITPYSLLERN